MLDVVDLFREHDTRDELGIGSVRDAFADMFFPGTSTIMTRARYFLLVAWTYQRLERLRANSAQIAARARRAEIDLIEVIQRSDDNEGNIGKVAKTALKRLPSSVYWQGLSVWGIRGFQGAQAQYHRGLDRYYAQITRHGGRASERDVEHDDLVAPNWHAGLILPPPDFPGECSLSLTCREAEYLAERIRLSPDLLRLSACRVGRTAIAQCRCAICMATSVFGQTATEIGREGASCAQFLRGHARRAVALQSSPS